MASTMQHEFDLTDSTTRPFTEFDDGDHNLSSDAESSTRTLDSEPSEPFIAAWSPACLPICVAHRELPPMDVETYRVVLRELGRIGTASSAEMASERVSVPDDLYSDLELCLRQDMTKNKVVWSGNFWEDFWYFLTNMHPVVAMFYSHPLHPISRGDRLLVYGLSFFFVILTTMAVTQGRMCRLCHACLECRLWGCHETNGTCALDYSWHNTTGELRIPEVDVSVFLRFMSTFCCQAHNWGSLWFLDTFGLIWGSLLYSFLTNVLFSFMCFQLVLCGCVQMRSRRSRIIGEWVGHVLFVVIASLVVWQYWEHWWGYNWTHNRLPVAIQSFISVKLISWAGATLVDVVIFTIFFRIQREKNKGDWLKWLDPPEDKLTVDSRSSLAKMLNPRFHVQASEYMRVTSQRRMYAPASET